MEMTISDAMTLSSPMHDETWHSSHCDSTCSLTSPDAPLRMALSRPSSVLHLVRVRLTSSLAVSLTCMSSPMAALTSDTIFWCPGRPCSREAHSSLSACSWLDQYRCLLCMSTAHPKDMSCQTRPHAP